jgi:hypothetical protein
VIQGWKDGHREHEKDPQKFRNISELGVCARELFGKSDWDVLPTDKDSPLLNPGIVTINRGRVYIF